ncbi:hypothetical protein DFP74_2958 [Nocardiopsis sp. Huas11]|uniref:hypothetical protein n=1 Tax=Nocardiopsis sp. Huas11 TaxID=2183912 RepID=UPI000EB1CF50|nr:hypothetical protein [Nocardiopsis sp. Huas11]RKS07294.1 hypothetical protein DFP74_2958 [Nocardiopsis sp. Huas11]
MSASHARHVDASDPRPRRVRHRVGAVAIALAALAGVAGLAGFTGLAITLTRSPELPDFVAEVRGPGEASFTVDEGFTQPGLYSSPADADEGACAVVLPDGEERDFDRPPYGHTIASGDWGWSLVGRTHPVEPGDQGGPGEYTLVCDGDPEVLYALGDLRDDGRTFALETADAVAPVLLVPFLALVLGGAALLATGLRRGARERHPLTERIPPGHT